MTGYIAIFLSRIDVLIIFQIFSFWFYVSQCELSIKVEFNLKKLLYQQQIQVGLSR